MSDDGTGFSGRTAWTRSLETPLRRFLRTETGGAAVLLLATVAALVWVNADASSYDRVWNETLSIRVAGGGISQDLRYWVNSGLMTLFFFVVGLEARREFDLGELRERRRLLLPFLAGVAGMVVPIALYLAVNAGKTSAHGWGAAMSSDTAFALGTLALVGPRFQDRLRAYVLTVAVVDDVVALAVIAFAYSGSVSTAALIAAAALFVAILLVRSARVHRGAIYFVLGAATWVAMEKSGVDPIVVGLAMGLLTYAYPASRGDLERATDLFRRFREQPTPELARSAQLELTYAISPNDRLQQLFHPWTGYLIVPLFALANAGIAINGSFLSSAYTSSVTLGIVVAYVVGKPLGIVLAPWLTSFLTRGRIRPPVGWAAVAGGGAAAGIGFTVSLLIATLAFHGSQLGQAKLGVLTAALASSVLAWLVFRIAAMLPRRLRIQALVGSGDLVLDLAVEVDPDHDHIRGSDDALITLVEYGDFECPFCGRAEPAVREVLADFTDVRYVWRHLPLTDVHPHAQLAAEAAEAAAEQDAFWEMHDLLLTHQGALRRADLLRYAEELELDVERFDRDMSEHLGAAHVSDDVDSADLSGVSGTPTFFINGRRHYGAYDLPSLKQAMIAAGARATLRT